jgi:hypothetical protein
MGAAPSLQTIRASGSNSVTLGLKVRPGAAGTTIASFSPRAIVPAMLVTVEFHRGNPAASVSNDQTRSRLAWIGHSMEQDGK